MRKVVMALLLSVFVISQTGCIMNIGAERWPCHKRVIEVDGQLYVVDIRTNRARRIELRPESETESTIETEIELLDD